MVRSVGITAVVVGLAWAGLAAAQSSSSPQAAPARQRYITVREEGRPPQRCILLRTWHEPNGVPAFQVRAVESGEIMTIVGSGPPAEGGDPRALSTRIFHWGSDNRPPAGAPQPPSVRAMAAPPPKSTPATTPSAPRQANPPVRSVQGSDPRTLAPRTVAQDNGNKPALNAPLSPPTASAMAAPAAQPAPRRMAPGLPPPTTPPVRSVQGGNPQTMSPRVVAQDNGNKPMTTAPLPPPAAVMPTPPVQPALSTATPVPPASAAALTPSVQATKPQTMSAPVVAQDNGNKPALNAPLPPPTASVMPPPAQPALSTATPVLPPQAKPLTPPVQGGDSQAPSPRTVAQNSVNKPTLNAPLPPPTASAMAAPATQPALSTATPVLPAPAAALTPSVQATKPQTMSAPVVAPDNGNKLALNAPLPPPTASVMPPPPAQPALSTATPVLPPQANPLTPPVQGGDSQAPSPRTVAQNSVNKPTPTAPLLPLPPSTAPALPELPALSKATPAAVPQPVSPASPSGLTGPLLPAPRPTPAILTGRTLEVAPPSSTASPTPAQPANLPAPVVASKPAAPPVPAALNSAGNSSTPLMTPMSTQVVQQPAPRLPDVHDCTPSTPPQPRLVPSAGGTVVGSTCDCCNGPKSCESCCQSCNPCSQPSCLCCTTSPMRQSFFSRLFKPQRGCDCKETVCTPAATPAPEAKPAAAAPPVPAVVSVPAEPVRPRDWRESWGKVEPWKDHKDTAQPNSVKPAETVSQRLAPKPVELETPKEPDPIKNPDLYRDLAMDTQLSNNKMPQQKPPELARPKRSLFAPRPAAEPKMPEQPAVAAALPPSTAATPDGPSPMRSPGRGVQLPANEANAFWTPPQPPPSSKEPRPKANGFDRDPNVPPQQNGPPRIAPGYAGPLPPSGPMPLVRQAPLPMTPSSPDAGVPDAMGNAFTVPGTRRPIPADFGGTPQEPNGFDPMVQMGQGSPPQGYSMGMPARPRPPMPNMVAVAPRPPMGNPFMNVPAAAMPAMPGNASAAARPSGVPQLLLTLKDSLYPSERESAAEKLSELSWRAQPQVVDSLMKSAREDPAATVRVACVHALAQMKVGSSEAMALVRDLKSDRDPRVRQEAEEALNALGDSGIQQASHK